MPSTLSKKHDCYRIGVDIDDTIADSTEYWLKRINRKFKTKVKRKNLKGYDCANDAGINAKEALDYIIKLTFLPSFHQENKPIPYSLETLRSLRQAGHKIFFVSCRQTAIKHHTLDWLKKYGFWEIASGVLHRDEWKPHLDFKREITQKLKLDFFIDDSLDHAKYIASSTTTVFLLDQPWNQNDTLPHVIRVKNWPAILNYFKRSVEHANKPLHPLKLSQLLKPHDTRFGR